VNRHAPTGRWHTARRLVAPVITAVAVLGFTIGLAGAFGSGPAAGAFPGSRTDVALDSHVGERAAREAEQIAGGQVKRVERTERGVLDVTVATDAREFGVELSPTFELIRVDYGNS
jgi:hypothetical protein